MLEPTMDVYIKDRDRFYAFLSDSGIKDFKGKKILEVGFRDGLFMKECEKAGLVPVGLEVNKDYCQEFSAANPHITVVLYDGIKFPFPDSYFDFVVSFNVLEHVQSLDCIFDESLRVLKPGGLMYHLCPNHHSFYEGHFKVIWMPFFSKSLGRTYLKLLRKYNIGYEGLQIIKPRNICRILSSKKDIKFFSLCKEHFIDKFTDDRIAKVHQKNLRWLLLKINKLSTLKKIILKMVTYFDLYYPFVVVAAKRSGDDKT